MAAEERYLTKIAGRLNGTGGETQEATLDRPSLRLPVRMLDRFLGGFRPGTLTLLDSAHPYLSEIIAMLCVQSVGELGGDVIYVDGGNSFDPYGLITHARRLGVDKDHVLDNISVARAFTAHQLTSLLHDSLPREIAARARAEGHDGGRPLTVIVSQISDLYTDRDVGRSEARGMLELCAGRLLESTEATAVVTVVTNYGLSKLGTKGALRRALYGKAHRVVRIERAGHVRSDRTLLGPGGLRWHTAPRRPGRDTGRMLITLPSEGRSLLYHPTPRHQRTLDDFEPDDIGPMDDMDRSMAGADTGGL